MVALLNLTNIGYSNRAINYVLTQGRPLSRPFYTRCKKLI